MTVAVKTPLRRKYAITIIALIFTILVLTFFANTYFVLKKNKSVFTKSFINDTKTIIEYFSQTFADGLKLDDDILLIQTFNRVKKIKNIEYAILFDKNKKVLFHSEVFSKQSFSPKILKPLFESTNTLVTPKFDPNVLQSTYMISRSFYSKNNKFYGMLLIKFTTDNLQAILSDIKNKLIIFLLVILLLSTGLSVVFSFVLSKITVKPIETITKGISKIGDGDLEYKIVINQEDELGYLADQFNQMTGKIKNAQVEMLKRQKEDEQLQIAKQIQTSLFPAKNIIEDNFEIGGFSYAAKTIGGDYYNFFKLKSGKLLYILSDVQGKGVPAALVTFMIGTGINALHQLQEITDSGELLASLNNMICNEMKKFKRFATTMVCLYDPTNGELNFVSGGHDVLFVYRAATREIETIKNIFLPIGIMPKTPYKSMNITLEKNDFVFIYSDGVNEARNKEQEEYGKERFYESLKKHADKDVNELLTSIYKDVEVFIDGFDQFDDTTLLIQKRK